MASISVQDQLLNPRECSDYLGVPLQTLYAWRSRSQGPKALTVGKHLRYRRSDVDAWLARDDVQ